MSRFLLVALMLFATLIWGWTFVVMKEAVADYPVVAFLAIRFAIGASLLGLLAVRHLSRETLLVGAGIGIPLSFGYLSQTWGLCHTTATNSGLITGLFVLMTPLANRFMFGVKVPLSTWAMIALSLAGLGLLTGSGPTPMNVGDLLTLGAAALYGVHIAMLDRYAKEHPPVAMAFAQTASAAIIFLLMLPIEGAMRWPNAEVWKALLITGVLATCVAFLIQVYVQQRLSAVATVLILSLESVFAALFGWILLEEWLTGIQFVGMALMVVAVVGVQCMPYAKSRSSNNSSATNIASAL